MGNDGGESGRTNGKGAEYRRVVRWRFVAPRMLGDLAKFLLLPKGLKSENYG
jgi:hypothetical protein